MSTRAFWIDRLLALGAWVVLLAAFRLTHRIAVWPALQQAWAWPFAVVGVGILTVVVAPRLTAALAATLVASYGCAILLKSLIHDWPGDKAKLVLECIPFILLACVLLRLLHLCKCLVVAAFRSGAASGAGYDPLPSQKAVIRQLHDLTGGGAWLGASPNVIALRGTWGTGKTTVLRSYEREARRDGRVAFVYVDAWRHESDSIREFAIYGEASSSSELIWPLGWLFVPVIRCAATRALQICKIGFTTGKVTVSSGDSRDLSPPIIWGEYLARLAAATRIYYRRVVIVLDEIDRCTPEAAQEFVTLLRRFLSVGNVSVIVPHVAEHLRYTVFHPAQSRIPDMRAAADSIMWQELHDGDYFKRYLEKRLNPPDGAPAAAAKDKGAEADSSPPSSGDLPIAEVISAGLTRAFLFDTPRVRAEAMMTQMEEKYLFDDLVIIPPPAAADLRQLLDRDPRLRRSLGPTYKGSLTQGPMSEILDEVWEEVSKIWKDNAGRQVSPPTLRQLKGSVGALLSSSGATLAPLLESPEMKKVEPETATMAALATLVLVALRFATLRVHRGPQ